MPKYLKFLIPFGLLIAVILAVNFEVFKDEVEKIRDRLPPQVEEQKDFDVQLPTSESQILKPINEVRQSPLRWDSILAKTATVAADFVGEAQSKDAVSNFDFRRSLENLGFKRGTVIPLVAVNVPTLKEAVVVLHEKHASFLERNDLKFAGVGAWANGDAPKVKTVFVFLLSSKEEQ